MDLAVNAIFVQGLAKRFGEVQAVTDVSSEVRPGELLSFLGPNSGGMITTINISTGLATPDSGVIRIADTDCAVNPQAAQHLIGIVPDESNLYPKLTGLERLSFCAALYGMRPSLENVFMQITGVEAEAMRKEKEKARGGGWNDG